MKSLALPFLMENKRREVREKMSLKNKKRECKGGGFLSVLKKRPRTERGRWRWRDLEGYSPKAPRVLKFGRAIHYVDKSAEVPRVNGVLG